jgi:hypothetical protein
MMGIKSRGKTETKKKQLHFVNRAKRLLMLAAENREQGEK